MPKGRRCLQLFPVWTMGVCVQSALTAEIHSQRRLSDLESACVEAPELKPCGKAGFMGPWANCPNTLFAQHEVKSLSRLIPEKCLAIWG